MMARRFGVCALVLASCAGVFACGGANDEEGTVAEATEALRQIRPTGLTKAQLKARVRRIASENTLKTDDASRASARAQINPFIADLARLYKTPPATQELSTGGFAGTWKQLWSDDFRPAPPGAPAGDPASIFQVVTPKGYFYNFSNLVVPTPPGAPKVVIGSFLRGAYTLETPTAHVLDIVFTRVGGLPSALPDSKGLGDLVEAIESGRVAGAGGPPGGVGGPPAGAGGRPAGPPPGAGPVGVKGKIQNLYLDADLRIALGGTSEQQFNKVYVLERVTP
jgi:hypothetical protein